MDQVEEIKSKTDIAEVVGEYVPLKRAGRNFKGLCPWHGEKTPSFMVNPELQIYKCFGCNEGGDVYAFLQKMEGMEFGEALKKLADRAGVKLTSYKPSRGEEDRERLIGINTLAAKAYHWLLTKHQAGKPALGYLTGRGMKEEMIENFNVGYAPGGWEFLGKFMAGKKGVSQEDLRRVGLVVEGKNYDRFRDRVMFPLSNHRGQIVGFAGRVMPGADEMAGGKYVNTPETELYHKSELLYGFEMTRSEIKRLGWVVVVEGEIDAIASYQAGVKNVVAIKGSALTERQVELLRRVCEKVVLGLDADLAGDSAARRGITIAENAGMEVTIVDWGKASGDKVKDAADVAIADPKLWKEMTESAVSVYEFYIDSAVKRFGINLEGKVKVAKDVLPFFGQIADEIRRDDLLKSLALKLDVEVTVLRSEMVKIAKNDGGTVGRDIEKYDQKGSERERREGRVVMLAILGDRTKDLVGGEVGEMITSGFWRKVAEALGRGIDVKSLPAELKDKVGELLMTDEEYDEKRWREAVSLLEQADIKERLKRPKDSEETRLLGKRKAELTKDR